MPLNMSRRKQSNPKPLKSEGEENETTDASITSPLTPDNMNGGVTKMDNNGSRSSSPSAEEAKMLATTAEDGPVPDSEVADGNVVDGKVPGEKVPAGKATVEWPVKKGTTLGPFSARIEPVLEEWDRGNSICARGTSGSLFSIFVLEFYCKEVLNKTNIKPASKNGPRSALVYIYKPDKQLYLLVLRDVKEQEDVATLFLERGQDKHPETSGDVDLLIEREMAAASAASAAVAQSQKTIVQISENRDVSGGPSPQRSSPGNSRVDGLVDPAEVPSVSCQSCGVAFRNPANLSAHQLYYCAARETIPVPTATRERGLTHPASLGNPDPPTTRAHLTEEAIAAAAAKEKGQLDDLICILCKATFTNLTNCLSHMVRLHTEHNSQACKCCNFISSEIRLLKEHMLIHVRGSGINPNIFMQSQSSRGPMMGPLAIQGLKDRGQEENRKKRKSPEGQSRAVGSSSPESHSPTNSDGLLSLKGDFAPRGQGLSPRSNRESPLSSDARKSPTDSSKEDPSNHGMIQNRHIGRFLCEECDIFFSSYKNFVAHKQFYCQGQKREGKKPLHISSQPVPPIPLSFLQCASCLAVFPTRDKLAVHTLYFCPHQKNGLQSPSDKSVDKSAEGGRTSVNVKGSNSNCTNEKESPSMPPSEKPKIKVEHAGDEPSSSRKSASPRAGGIDKGITPCGVSLKTPVSLPGMPAGPVFLAPGNVPPYVSQGGATPVYILASHVYVTPPGISGSREESSPPTSLLRTVPMVPTGKEMACTGERCTSVAGEKPLDLSVRKRKASDNLPGFETSPPKLIKHEFIEGKMAFPLSPPQLEQTPSSAANISPSLLTKNAHGQIQYKCPGCHITFNRFESLDVHRQFYCQSEDNRDERETSGGYPGGNILAPPSLPPLPYYQVISSNVSAPNGSTLVPALATVNLRDSPRRPASQCSEAAKSPSKDGSIASPAHETGDASVAMDSRGSPIADQGRGNNVASPRNHPNESRSPLLKESSSGSRNKPAAIVPPVEGDRQKSLPPFRHDQKGESSDSSAQRVPMYIPSVVRYMCPSCGVSFMKLESLSAHQQFYCRASQGDAGVNRSSPRADGKNIQSADTCTDIGSGETQKNNTARSDAHVGAENMEIKSESQDDEKEGDEAMDIDVQRLSPKPPDCANDSDRLRQRSGSANSAYSSDGQRDIGKAEVDSEGACVESTQTPRADPYNGLEETPSIRTNGNVSPSKENDILHHIKQEKLDDDDNLIAAGQPLGDSPTRAMDDVTSVTTVNGDGGTMPASGEPERNERCKSDSTASEETPADLRDKTTGRHKHHGIASAGTAGRPSAPIMMKHCRACNISFSSLSTFIAHKKYYCASHHVTKNAVR